MFAEGNIELDKLVFKPEDTIRFNTNPGKQQAVVEMTNNHDFDVVVKWKSTRPPIYGVEPNFVIVRANTTQKFVLFCRGAEKEYGVPRDRFSAVISRIKPNVFLPAKKIWKESMQSRDVFVGRLHKKFIYVVYDGVNFEEWWNCDMKGKREPTRQPTFGLADEDHRAAVVTALLAHYFQQGIVPMQPPREDDDGNLNH
ncbi:unnamed protein product [Caenorhabditis brenneri]